MNTINNILSVLGIAILATVAWFGYAVAQDSYISPNHLYVNGGAVLEGSSGANGLEVAYGNVRFGVSEPILTHINGDLEVTGYVSSTSMCINGDCQSAWPGGSGGSYWAQNGSDLYVSDASWEVGIGTLTPSSMLHVLGKDGVNATVGEVSGGTAVDGLYVIGGDGGNGGTGADFSGLDGGYGGNGANIVVASGSGGDGGNGDTRANTNGGDGGDGGSLTFTVGRPGVGGFGRGTGVDGGDGVEGVINFLGKTYLKTTPAGDFPALYFDQAAGQDWRINPSSGYLSFYDINNSRNIMQIQPGVNGDILGDGTFESGGLDYAEYIEKDDPAQDFEPGDIIGIKNGKIVTNTDVADSIMIISSEPSVLGGSAGVNNDDDFDHGAWEMAREKVAFIGQVDVSVVGPVHAGDYILPSGNNDGIGIAKPKNEITFDEYIRLVVGVAWESSNDAGIKKINVAVGIK